MKPKLLKKLKMFLNLSSFLDKNKKVWESVNELQKAIDKFNSNIEYLQELKADIEIDYSPEKNKKDKCRKALISEVIPVINILKAYSIECKNKSLLKKCDIKKKKLEKMKDSCLADYCKTIFKESRKFHNKSLSATETLVVKADDKNNIRNYGLSGQMVDNIKEVKDTFNEACLSYFKTKSEIEKHEIEFEYYIKKNDSILKNKLDLLISIFKAGQSGFYKNYDKMRKLEKNQKETIKKKAIVKKTNISLEKYDGSSLTEQVDVKSKVQNIKDIDQVEEKLPVASSTPKTTAVKKRPTANKPKTLPRARRKPVAKARTSRQKKVISKPILGKQNETK